MANRPAPFVFPAGVHRLEAESLLAEAYRGLDAGRLLRRALKVQRKQGWQPPMDVQYVCEPALADFPDGLGVVFRSDVLVYAEFPGMQECLEIFEAVLAQALTERLERGIRRWRARHAG